MVGPEWAIVAAVGLALALVVSGWVARGAVVAEAERRHDAECALLDSTISSLRAELAARARQPVTVRLLPSGWWAGLNGLAALLLVATMIGCCGPTVQPPPVVVSRQLPPLLKDRRDEVVSRWHEIAYVGTEVRMPADLP